MEALAVGFVLYDSKVHWTSHTSASSMDNFCIRSTGAWLGRAVSLVSLQFQLLLACEFVQFEFS